MYNSHSDHWILTLSMFLVHFCHKLCWVQVSQQLVKFWEIVADHWHAGLWRWCLIGWGNVTSVIGNVPGTLGRMGRAGYSMAAVTFDLLGLVQWLKYKTHLWVYTQTVQSKSNNYKGYSRIRKLQKSLPYLLILGMVKLENASQILKFPLTNPQPIITSQGW